MMTRHVLVRNGQPKYREPSPIWSTNKLGLETTTRFGSGSQAICGQMPPVSRHDASLGGCSDRMRFGSEFSNFSAPTARFGRIARFTTMDFEVRLNDTFSTSALLQNSLNRLRTASSGRR